MNRIMSIASDLQIELFNLNSIESFHNYYVDRIFWILNICVIIDNCMFMLNYKLCTFVIGSVEISKPNINK